MLAEFDNLDQDPQLHHRATLHLLAKGKALRAQVERFASGTPLQELPELERWVLELYFIPLAERVQGADHAIISRAVLRKKVSGPYVSLIVRRNEMTTIMFDDLRAPIVI